MSGLDDLTGRLEKLVDMLDGFDEKDRAVVFELLDGFDVLHRLALSRLAAGIAPELLAGLREDETVAWLLDSYGVGVDQHAAAEKALETIRPYIHSHGGSVEVIGADAGVVQLRMSGACAGCSASAVTLTEGVEEALREHVPGYARMEVEEQNAAPHPPPGPTLLEIGFGLPPAG